MLPAYWTPSISASPNPIAGLRVRQRERSVAGTECAAVVPPRHSPRCGIGHGPTPVIAATSSVTPCLVNSLISKWVVE